ncbi:hypothetical protein PPS11_19979 [Pseudomonas putida S11]|nr:hypothetical protein PPS11_19979 [Pseudomonas putida S11]
MHQGKGQFALAAVLVGGGFLRGGGGAAQQGDSVFLGLVAGYTLVQGPDPVVQGGARRVGVEVVVEGAAGGFGCRDLFRRFSVVSSRYLLISLQTHRNQRIGQSVLSI